MEGELGYGPVSHSHSCQCRRKRFRSCQSMLHRMPRSCSTRPFHRPTIPRHREKANPGRQSIPARRLRYTGCHRGSSGMIRYRCLAQMSRIYGSKKSQQESISELSFDHSRVVRVRRVGNVNCRVDDWDIMPATPMKTVQEVFPSLVVEPRCVFKVTIPFQIVDIRPKKHALAYNEMASIADKSYQIVSRGILKRVWLFTTSSSSCQLVYPHRH